MSNGSAHEIPAEDKNQLTSIDKLLQANRDYYHSWRAMWASDKSGAVLASFVKEENSEQASDEN